MANPKELFFKISALEDRFFALAAPYILLVIRLTVGYTMFRLGYGKITHLDVPTGLFERIGIPAPGFHAVVVSCCELVGGLLLMAGLFTRFAVIMISVIMLVAILSVHRAEMAVFFSTPAVSMWAAPVLFLVVYLLIGVSGPGRFSLDHLLFGDPEAAE